MLTRRARHAAAGTYQQGAVAVELSQQHASIVEDVSGANAAVKVADGGLQAGVQLRVDVELPGIGRLLNLCVLESVRHKQTPPQPHCSDRLTFNTTFSDVMGSVAW